MKFERTRLPSEQTAQKPPLLRFRFIFRASGSLALQKALEDFPLYYLDLHAAFEPFWRWAERNIEDLFALIGEKLRQLARCDLARSPVCTEVSDGTEKILSFVHRVEERYRLSVIEDYRQKLIPLLGATYDHDVSGRSIHI